MNLFIRVYQRLFYSPAKTKVIVLGFQKSGTTAIASLLARACGVELSSDPLYHTDFGKGEQAEMLLSRNTDSGPIFTDFPKLFGSPMIKDPDFIYAFDDISQIYKNAKFIYITRNPLDTIKSICGRLGITRNMMDTIPAMTSTKANLHWQSILNGNLPKLRGCYKKSFIENLAHRWQLSTDIYLAHAENMFLCRYEDFLGDKEKVIVEMVNKLDLENKKSIGDYVDTSYQLSGNIRISSAEFFGTKVVSEIEDICASGMASFGYVK